MPTPESFFNKVAGLKKRLRYKYFPMNFGKFFKTRFMYNVYERLHLAFRLFSYGIYFGILTSFKIELYWIQENCCRSDLSIWQLCNPLMHGSNKGHTYLNKPAGLFKYV